ncbi:MAG TPA: hypothetical protein VGR76_07445 [Candidatus Angelobacter sp.]|nr:hypothetical protein [Candidatus Angelobacter sp.]
MKSSNAAEETPCFSGVLRGSADEESAAEAVATMPANHASEATRFKFLMVCIAVMGIVFAE